MPAPHRRSIITYLPLLNVSLPKLALAVIFGALLTMSLFIVENRRLIATSRLASFMTTRGVNIEYSSDKTPRKLLTVMKGTTVLEVIEMVSSQSDFKSPWSCKVNNLQLTISLDRYAVKDMDIITCNSKGPGI